MKLDSMNAVYVGIVGVASKLKALDNEVKINILKFLAEEGEKSITDISKSLDINFSTAHKYLEQLERAKFVHSSTVSKTRLKRLFKINNFINCCQKLLFFAHVL